MSLNGLIYTQQRFPSLLHMNNSKISSDHPMDHSKNGLIFAVTFPLSVLLISLILTVASDLCTRFCLPHSNNSNPPQNAADQNFVAIELGLDEATLHSFPKLFYSQYNLQKTSSATSCCSICLADYRQTDVLQLLPDCGHLFHLKCVNPWLRLHPSCPLCRKSLVPALAPVPVVSPLVDQMPPLVIRQE